MIKYVLFAIIFAFSCEVEEKTETESESTETTESQGAFTIILSLRN